MKNELGYGSNVKDTHRSEDKVTCICDGCGASFQRRWHHVKKMRPRCECLSCIRKGPRNPNYSSDLNEFKRYRNKVNNLTKRVYEANKEKINPQDLPRTPSGTPGGYQLDHKISIREGFNKSLPIEVIASVENLQMLPWLENRLKG